MNLPNDLEFTAMSIFKAKAIIIVIPINDHKSVGTVQLETAFWDHFCFSFV